MALFRGCHGRRICIRATGLTLVFTAFLVASAAGDARRFAVRDSIEMEVFAEDSDSSANPIMYSPDGNYFFIVSSRGLLASNQVQSTIWLFDSRQIRRFLEAETSDKRVAPRPLVRIASSSNFPSISGAKWSADGSSIEFLARDQRSIRRLFVADVRSGAVEPLTPKGLDVADYERHKDLVVFTAQLPIDESQVYQSAGPDLPDAQIGTGVSLLDLLYPNWITGGLGKMRRQLWLARNGGAAHIVTDSTGNGLTLAVPRDVESVMSLSPSGRYLVSTNTVDRIPSGWEIYLPAVDGDSFRFVPDDQLMSRARPKEFRAIQYVLIDLIDGKSTALIDAPFGFEMGYYNRALATWSPDERYVALANTFMPVNDPKEGTASYLRPCVAVVEVSTKKVACVQSSTGRAPNTHLTQREVTKIVWGTGGDELILSYSQADGAEFEPRWFALKDGRWNQVDDATQIRSNAPVSAGITGDLRQNVNEKPLLVASDRSGKRATIWDPNPQLNDIALGEASVFRWHDKVGHQWEGGLVKPPACKPGHRYPLVIQTHGFNPGQFLVDGYAPTANAARALAAKDIVVLQVGEHGTAAQGTPREPQDDGLAGYEAAINQLAAEGMIDPGKVGIIGFSHTGWTVSYSLIHAPQYFRAATMAEADDFSFYTYLMNADYGSGDRAQYYADGIGSVPFDKGLEKWIADSPGFNSDKIHAPILFEENSPPALIYSWDLYAALRLQRKPVELLYIRSGAHVLVKPRQRLASQEMNVDWFDFWLNGHEDSDSQKAEQYCRWRKLRELQQQSEKPQ